MGTEKTDTMSLLNDKSKSYYKPLVSRKLKQGKSSNEDIMSQ